MPFIYLIGFILCLIIGTLYPNLARLLFVVKIVCLGGIVVFSLVELHMMTKKDKSQS